MTVLRIPRTRRTLPASKSFSSGKTSKRVRYWPVRHAGFAGLPAYDLQRGSRPVYDRVNARGNEFADLRAGAVSYSADATQHRSWHNERPPRDFQVTNCFYSVLKAGPTRAPTPRPPDPPPHPGAPRPSSDRRHPYPGDHGARAARAPLARVSRERFGGGGDIRNPEGAP